MSTLFHTATLKLTGWYLLIIMLISLLFSVIVFEISTAELRRGLPNEPGIRRIILDADRFEALRQARVENAVDRLIGNLAVLNLFMLGIGGGASYLLARRTLRPIEENIDRQTRFVSDASHELRTPLASMRTELEVGLRDKKLTSKEARVLLESSLEEVHSLQSLSERLLQLSQDEPITLEPVSLLKVAEQVRARHKTALAEKDITFHAAFKETHVLAQGAMLEDLVSILVENAIKYSAPNTSITMDVSQYAKRAKVSIADEGDGIASENVPFIFDRFYRADTSRTSQQVKGHGLGLSIARHIAEKHNTKLEVISEPGKGTTFWFTLPVEIKL